MSPVNRFRADLAVTACAAFLVALSASFAHAQKPDARIDPQRFRYKTVAQCEKILGKVAYKDETNKNGFDRDSWDHIVYYFASRIPGIARIAVYRCPEHGAGGPLAQNIRQVEYHFPKGTVTWQQAFDKIGVPKNGVTARKDQYGLTLENMSRRVADEATWTPANKDEPKYDVLNFAWYYANP